MPSRQFPKLWPCVYLAIIAGCFVFSLLVMAPGIVASKGWPTGMPLQRSAQMAAVVIILCAGTAPALCVMCWARERSGNMTRKWHRPSLWMSPFERPQPLQPGYLISMMSAALGMGLLVRMPWGNPYTMGAGGALLVIAFGLFLGVEILLQVFRAKFHPVGRHGD